MEGVIKTFYLMRNGIPIKKQMTFLDEANVLILEYNLLTNEIII